MLNDFLADYEAFPQEKRPFLTIGPWHHFDFQGYLEMLRAGVDWFHAHLQDKPLRRTAPIKLFVMGADEWREFPQWPPPHREQRLYLQQNGSLLCTSPRRICEATAFLYDPADPTPIAGRHYFQHEQCRSGGQSPAGGAS
jgi:predicted acyl esterase